MCQRFCQFGLADTRGTQEQEAADGAVGVGDTGAGTQNGVRNLLHGFVLTDHALVQHVRQTQQLFALALDQLGNGDARPARHDAGDFLIGHAVTQQAGFLLFGGDFFFLVQLLLQGGQLAVLQLACLGVIAGAGGFFNFRLGGFHFGAQALHLVDGVLFVLPLRLFAVEGVTQLCHLFFQRIQTLLGKLVRFLL